jgi:hypothetical protein
MLLKKQTPWLVSANELYRPSDRRLSEKLVPTFADKGVSGSQRDGSYSQKPQETLNLLVTEERY